MIKKMYSIYDEKAECFSPVYMFGTHGEAIRSITQTLDDSNTTLAKFPSDYSLFHVGDFDDLTGEIVPCKKSLGCIIEFKRSN